jgi:4-aminobutyrate aminotransferase/(S)-3-amino-2-methylpropionate transaminase
MGPALDPAEPPKAIVYATGQGSNLIDVDGNRYVDLAAGFGSLLLGHRHPSVVRALKQQADRLLQSMGDVHPSDVKIELCERLTALYPKEGARVILGQSGADAVTAALKTALLASGKAGVVAFSGAYHGLSYAPLAACGLRASYREPFADQLSRAVVFLDYPATELEGARVLDQLSATLRDGTIGAVLIEPILGRGGCIVPPRGFLQSLAEQARRSGAVTIADEIWTGLGRAGHWLYSTTEFTPDLVCLGKGLGGGLPISACLGAQEVMQHWRREAEAVHTSTFAGAPPACAAALATLDALEQGSLVERSKTCGAAWKTRLEAVLSRVAPRARVNGIGLMLALDLDASDENALAVQRALLERGYIVSTGGGKREAIVLTPPLTIAEELLDGFTAALSAVWS